MTTTSASKQDSIYEILPANPSLEEDLEQAFSLSSLAARTLANRGYSDLREVERFLHPSLDRDWVDPFLLPGMQEGAQALWKALLENERICIYGDYDVDGITATSILVLALRGLGAQVFWFIPNRFSQGYGLSTDALNHVIEKYSPQFFLTVDNGISARNEVNYLLERGVSVVVSDHHTPDTLVPENIPVIDPKLNPEGPGQNLCGAAVALKLLDGLGKVASQYVSAGGNRRAQELVEAMGEMYWRHFVDLAALGTIADIMELDCENRALVDAGIKRMKHTTRLGIASLLNLLKIPISEIEADNLSFSIIPRLNAAGRMDQADIACKLLLTEDSLEATSLASMIQSLNEKRKQAETEVLKSAQSQAEASLKAHPNMRALVLGGDGWHEGVIGICASRLARQFQRPCILVSFDGGCGKGSGRSIGSIDLLEAVSACSVHLRRFGGHKSAIGITIERESLEQFTLALNKRLASLPVEAFQERFEVAGIAELSEIKISAIEGLKALQPFGKGNPYPLFMSKGVRLRNMRSIGAAQNHLKALLEQNSSNSFVDAVMFNVPYLRQYITENTVYDAIYEPTLNSWKGKTSPQLLIRALEKPDFKSGTENLRRSFIGKNNFLPIQKEALDLLEDSNNTLAIMATGRGKSLIFQIHAARLALIENKASIFVFPLRALVNDQVFHLEQALAPFGVTCAVLTGETSEDERLRVYEGLKQGTIDIVLTTPEFLALHANRFAPSGRIGFLVIDEAHHAGDSKGGNRYAYQEFPRVVKQLGNPCVLCVSATVDFNQAAEIRRLFSIDKVLSDNSCRENLFIVDMREIDADKRSWAERTDDESTLTLRQRKLIELLGTNLKTVVYVNSRGQAEVLCKLLRKHFPDIAHQIAFYHAGLSKPERKQVEKDFRENTLRAIVSTSAFGEGVNIPDIRQIILYHLPFGTTEFNQMSGRAGRDGAPASIVLLFGEDDAQINEGILERMAPDRDSLMFLYRTLRTMENMQFETPPGILHASNDEIARYASCLEDQRELAPETVSAGLSIFKELRILSVEGRSEQRTIRFSNDPSVQVSLEDSIFYLEGMRLKESFATFREWALSQSCDNLLRRINHPIIPEERA